MTSELPRYTHSQNSKQRYGRAVAAAAAGLPLLFVASPASAKTPTADTCEIGVLSSKLGSSAAVIDRVLTLSGGQTILTSPKCGTAVDWVRLRTDTAGDAGARLPDPGVRVSMLPHAEDGMDASEIHVIHFKNGAIAVSDRPIEEEVDRAVQQRYPDLKWDKAPPSEPLGPAQPTASVADVPAEPEGSGTAAAAAAVDNGCANNSYTWSGKNESDTSVWRINKAGIPGNLDVNDTVDSLKAGPLGWETSRTDCSNQPFNSIDQHYAGTTTAVPGWDATFESCDTRDLKNTWKFVNSPDGVNNDWIAVACVWAIPIPFADDEIQEADVAFDSVNNFAWGNSVSSNCNDNNVTRKYMVSATATHEAGHAFGFGHVPNASDQTMTFQADICSKEEYTLGRGDLRGAREQYAP